MDPAKDGTFQKALKAQRVLTVFQEASGNRSDRGEVGFEPGHSRQFLIFPRSLRAFADSKIVGIKYDLFEEEEVPAGKSSAPAVSKERQKPKPRPKPAKKPRPRMKPKPKPKTKPSPRPQKPKDPPKPEKKIIPFHPPEADEDKDVNALKKQIRQAMSLLEDGKAVAAFNLLKRTVGGGVKARRDIRTIIILYHDTMMYVMLAGAVFLREPQALWIAVTWHRFRSWRPAAGTGQLRDPCSCTLSAEPGGCRP